MIPRVPSIALILAFGLGGCAVLAPAPPVPVVVRQPVAAFHLEARFALSHDGNSYAGRLDWRHGADGDDILVMNPFGQGVARLVRDQAGARLTVPGQAERRAADADALLAEVVGYRLPVSRLVGWVTGAGSDGDAVADPAGRVAARSDAGYRIEYAYPDDDPAAMPSRIVVHRDGEVDLRLGVDAWQVGEAAQ